MRGNGLDWKTTTSSESHDGMSGVAAFRRTDSRGSESATSDARQLEKCPEQCARNQAVGIRDFGERASHDACA